VSVSVEEKGIHSRCDLSLRRLIAFPWLDRNFFENVLKQSFPNPFSNDLLLLLPNSQTVAKSPATYYGSFGQVEECALSLGDVTDAQATVPFGPSQEKRSQPNQVCSLAFGPSLDTNQLPALLSFNQSIKLWL
jgi:hypothetical protein